MRDFDCQRRMISLERKSLLAVIVLVVLFWMVIFASIVYYAYSIDSENASIIAVILISEVIRAVYYFSVPIFLLIGCYALIKMGDGNG